MNFISGKPSSPTHTNTELMGELMIIYWVKSALNSVSLSEEYRSRLSGMKESKIFASLLLNK